MGRNIFQVEDAVNILALSNVCNGAGSFILVTEASYLAIRAVLSQKSSHGELSVAYASRAPDPTKRMYSTTREELLSLVYSVNSFQVLIPLVTSPLNGLQMVTADFLKYRKKLNINKSMISLD